MSTFDTYRPDLSLSTRPARQRKLLSPATVVAWIEYRLEKRRSRLALLEMSDAQLKDIGVSRADAYREGNTSFWK